MRIDGLGHGLFAIAVAGVAILSLSYGSFVPLGQPFPAFLPWRQCWVYGSAILLLASSVGLCLPRAALPSAAIVGVYETLWAVICALLIAASPGSIAAWYNFCEALAPLVGAWLLYAMLHWQSRRPPTLLASEGAVRVAQMLFGLT